GNFQNDNFGLGSVQGPVSAEAQDGSALLPPSNCNANFALGTSVGPRMRMYLCNNASPSRDGDVDNTVIAHEYTHGVHGTLVSGLLGYSQGGMSEGWADFFSLSWLAQPTDNLNGQYPIGQWLL